MANIDLMSRHYVTCHVSRVRHNYSSSSVITDVSSQVIESKTFRRQYLLFEMLFDAAGFEF